MYSDREILQTMERKLNLKQLQIKSLMNVTQAINNNIKIPELFKMYESFLSWEMGVTKMLFFLHTDEEWQCPSHIGMEDHKLLTKETIDYLLRYKRLKTIRKDEKPALKDFDLIIPVYHKNQVLSYTLIGGLEKSWELYDIIQFITTITNIVTVAIENKRLFKRRVRQEALEQEMKLAAEVQKMLIPSYIPKGKDVDIAYLYKPHYTVGGDYIDYIPLQDGEFILCIADISGKGISAALLMTNFQALLRTNVVYHEDLPALIRKINTSVYNTTRGDKFVTFFVAHVKPCAGELSYVNAGHHPPFGIVDGEIVCFKEGTSVLGAFEELPFVEEGMLAFEEELRLFLFTDGLTDIVNDRGEYFDEVQISRFLKEEDTIFVVEAEETINRIERRIEAFCGNRAFPDDIAIVTATIKKK